MLITLFLIWSWPFWVIFFLFLCSELYIIEGKEDGWLVTITTVIFLVAVLLFTDWKPWHSITFGGLLLFGLGYLIIGALYALFPRWAIFIKDKAKAFEGTYKRYKDDWNSENKSKWHANWSHYKTFEEMLRDDCKMPPMPWDRGVKGKLSMWMCYWPISATWMLIHKPAEYIFDLAYAWGKDKMAAISYAIFKSHFDGN